MNKSMIALGISALLAVPALAVGQSGNKQSAPVQPPRTVHGELVLYEMTNYNGDNWTVDGPSSTVHTDWNIRSLTIHPGDRWQICARSRFRDPCVILGQSVHDASLIGVDGQIGSARPAPEGAENN